MPLTSKSVALVAAEKRRLAARMKGIDQFILRQFSLIDLDREPEQVFADISAALDKVDNLIRSQRLAFIAESVRANEQIMESQLPTPRQVITSDAND